MLDVWRLQLLREVSRRGTIKAAAEAMSVSPSAVSQQLAVLEREAGVVLLEHSGRTVRLTEAARVLVRHADSITGAIAAAEADVASLREVVSGTLRVAAFPTAARAIMPRTMAALSRRHPGLRVTLRDLEATESVAALQMDEVDIAIVDEYAELSYLRRAGLEVHEFLRDPLYLALPPADEPGRPVRLEELREAFWIMDTERSQLFEVTMRACRAAGFEPHIRSNCKDFTVIIALVEAGLGVGVLPGLALHDRSIRATVCPLDPPISRRICAAIRPERRRHPAVASMLAELDAFGATA